MNILYTDITIIDPELKLDFKGYLHIVDGVIAYVGNQKPEISVSNCTIVDAKEFVACPGFFDMHVHLREPGHTHKETIETGTLSAANGGFTGVVCMPNTEPAIDSVSTIEYIQKRSKNNIVDVEICATITKNRLGESLSNIESLKNAGAVMFSDDGGCLESAEMMRRAFEYSSTIDALLTQHCEEHSMTKGFAMNEGSVSAELGLKGYPTVAEDIIVARDILLAQYCGNRRYHAAHLSSHGTIDLLRQARKRGQRVSAEVAPHHFILTQEAVRGYNTNAKMNPPLRTQKDVEAMIQGLADGVIDVIATDHAPHTYQEKHTDFDSAPNGIVGLETSLALSLTHLYHTRQLSMHRIIECMAINPRKILQLPIPAIKNGEVANITIFNPTKEWQIIPSRFLSKSKNTPFEDAVVYGKPIAIFNNHLYHQCTL